MAIQQPVGTDTLDSPDHSLSHRVFANDSNAPAQAIAVDSSGNVGIGTVSPTSGYKLDLVGNLYVRGYIVPTDTTWGINLPNNVPITLGGSAISSFGTDGTKSYWSVGTSIGSATGITMDGSGNVGIGTTAPNDTLHISGSAGTALRIVSGQNANARLSLYTDGGDDADDKWDIEAVHTAVNRLDFQNNDTAHLSILDTGNVGIGTTAPTGLLHINSASAEIANLVKISGRVSPEGGSGLYVNPNIQVGGARNAMYGVNIISSISNNVVGDEAVLYSSLRIGAPTGSGTVTNAYGLYVENPTVGANNYGAYIDGNVGIGTTAPTNLVSLGGNVSRTMWMERHTTANTAGNSLTIQGGGATIGATDKAGGDLILNPGVSTGSAESGVQIKGCVAGASGTTDRTLTTAIRVLGNKLGFYNQTPVVRQAYTAVSNPPTQTEVTAIRDCLVNLGLMLSS